MPFLQHNNRHDCWIFQSADVWTVHSSASLETFNNPYARLGVTRDETRRVSCFARKRTERENDIVSLKYSSLRFFWINLFTRLFAFFSPPTFFFVFFFAHYQPPWFRLVCLPTLATSKHCQRFSVKGGERTWEAVREEQVLGCFVGNTVKRSTMHDTRSPSAEHTSKPVLHLYCQHLGKERSEGGAAFEQCWVFTRRFSCRCSL